MTQHNPHIADFIQQVELRFQRQEPESFWTCEESYRKLLDTPCLEEAINHELRCLNADPAYTGREWRSNQLMIHRGSGYALSVSLFNASRRYIHTTPFYGMYAPLRDESLSYDLYKLPQGYRNEVFDATLRLEHAGSASTPPGGIVCIHSDQYAYDFKIEKPQLVIKFTTAPFHTLEWLFSKENLHAWQANDSDLPSTQLRVAAYLLGRLAHQSSLEPLKHLTANPNHAVRWAAIQNLGRLNRSEALAKLKEAVYDPHPHVRHAAAKTLEKLKKDK